MAEISLPAPGQKPWNLNPAIIAINDEVEDIDAVLTTGRLSTESLSEAIGEAVAPVAQVIETGRLSEDNITATVSDAISDSETVQDAITSGITAADIPGQVSEAVSDLDIPQVETDDTNGWKWSNVHGGNREVYLGQRTDGTFYPPELNPGVADQVVEFTTPDQGWRFTVRHAGNNEIVQGVRNDGTFYPESTAGTPTVRISGDSITAGWTGSSAALLSTALGMNVVVEGDPGRRSEWIAARQGGQPLRVTATGNAIPASGSVAVTASVYNHIGTTPPLYVVGTITGILNGVPGSLTITDEATGVGTFTRATAGRPVPLPPVTPFIRPEIYKDAWPILWPGRNNFKLANDGAQIVRDIEDMLKWTNRPDRALILSILPQVGEEIGTSGRTTLDSVNAMVRDAFPTHWIDAAAMLRSEELITAVGGTPTSTDTSNIANGLTPASFRSDDVHVSALGYKALNLIVPETYQTRGWIN